MLSKWKHVFAWIFNPLLVLFRKIGVKPNYITAASVFFAVFGAVFIESNITLSLILFAVAFLCDLLDGAMARKYKMITKFGAYIDSAVDRIIDFMFIYSVFVYAKQEMLGIIAAGFSPLISYFKHRADSLIKSEKKFITDSIFDRPERLIFIMLSFVLYLWDNQLGIMLFKLFILMSILAMFEIFVKVHRILKENKL